MIRVLALYDNGQYAFSDFRELSEYFLREEADHNARDSPRSRSNCKGCPHRESYFDNGRYGDAATQAEK